MYVPSRMGRRNVKQQKYIKKYITNNRRNWVYKNIVDNENRLAYDASRASYKTTDSRRSLERLQKSGYTRDNSISGLNYDIYHNPNTKKSILSFRGTKGPEDFFADLDIIKGKYDGREFQNAYTVYDKTRQKYGDDLLVTGHSLGGTKAIKVADKYGGKAVVFNPGTGLFPLDTGKHTTFVNSGDPISARVKGDSVVITPGGHSLLNYEDLFY